MTKTAALPVEGSLPSFGGATGWLNSRPLTAEGLRGKVVAVQFCTFSCINWLRTVPYLMAWAAKYQGDGLVTIGVHSPEFPFEHDVSAVETALAELEVSYPIAVDNDFAVWRAFDNHYWPALYLIDGRGRVRYHHFGEDGYGQSESAIQHLLVEAGKEVDVDLASVEPAGIHLSADWVDLRSPETYVGYARTSGFASPGGLAPDRSRSYAGVPRLALNHWALAGRWTVGEQTATLEEPGGRIVHRFQGRDANLVLGGNPARDPVHIKVLLDSEPPSGAHGLDIDEQGDGVVAEPRLYQLIRQNGPIQERTVEVSFLDAGARAYVFTFG